MVLIDDLLAKKENELIEMITVLRKRLESAPAGALRVSKAHNRPSYYLVKSEGITQSGGTYIKKDDLHIARKLAQKEYDMKLLEWAERSYYHIHQAKGIYSDETILDMLEKMPKGKQILVEPYLVTNDEYVKQWQEFLYEGKSIGDVPHFKTDRGEYVRSKSEKILADKFFKYGIPYRYECPLYLKGYGTVYPDFTLLNVRRRQEKYWEHLGLMSDPEYSDKAIRKINTYEKNGIFPGEKLLLTYESNNNFDTEIIDNMIKKYLL